MNALAKGEYFWWVAGGGGAGATVYYLLAVTLSTRIRLHRVIVGIYMTTSLLLGSVVAAGRDWSGYAAIGIGFLGSVAPLTALAAQTLDAVGPRVGRRSVALAAWTVAAGIAMAILGDILADVASTLVRKVPIDCVDGSICS
jgi:fluoride ion exporter CrcB/FEX